MFDIDVHSRAEFPDDPRFKLYKVFKRFRTTGLPCLIIRCFFEGTESTKAGTKISGRGDVKSEASKKALGESMEAMVAAVGKSSTDTGAKGQRKAAVKKEKVEKTAAEKEIKELKTTMKAPLVLIYLVRL